MLNWYAGEKYIPRSDGVNIRTYRNKCKNKKYLSSERRLQKDQNLAENK